MDQVSQQGDYTLFDLDFVCITGTDAQRILQYDNLFVWLTLNFQRQRPPLTPYIFDKLILSASP